MAPLIPHSRFLPVGLADLIDVATIGWAIPPVNSGKRAFGEKLRLIVERRETMAVLRTQRPAKTGGAQKKPHGMRAASQQGGKTAKLVISRPTSIPAWHKNVNIVC